MNQDSLLFYYILTPISFRQKYSGLKIYLILFEQIRLS